MTGDYQNTFTIAHDYGPALALKMEACLCENANRVLVRNSRQFRHRLRHGKLDFAHVCPRATFGVFGEIQLLAHLHIVTDRRPDIFQSLGFTPALRPTSRQRRATDGKALLRLDQYDAVFHTGSLAVMDNNVYERQTAGSRI